jgi:hypothetical protein
MCKVSDHQDNSLCKFKYDIIPTKLWITTGYQWSERCNTINYYGDMTRLDWSISERPGTVRK